MSPTSKNSIQLQNIIDNERTKDVKNIDKIKEVLLLKTYGISLGTAKKILGRYDITGLEVTEENKDLKCMKLLLELFVRMMLIY